ncbi:alpha/beta hydrolase-fold protein [Tenacibaculum caenipelagi]|uniref:Putative alpha/beta superfamily hydrolase n=1 Tax=Tenacibaculum caenipelagi TaxID=1325435 RepID=A0A4R6TD39_9FLAO|nr:alpha/beta hydrolase-fold protein [Tenacibaculum caenipelagi]TDQ25724.1 putative alpha/beta superfamily hydrolase [Tenacibaculum caenipelagi]
MNLKIFIVVLLFFLNLKSHSQINETNNIVGKTFLIQSKILNDEREVQVFLPDSYTESKKEYPVLYILDGQRYFLHGVSLHKSFVEFRQTPEFIIVGISKKQSDRNRNFSSNSKKYLDFIEKEAIGFIEQRFRTSKERLLFGWAYGGGFVIQAMTTNPDLFKGYIAASPFPLDEKINKVDSLSSKTPNFYKFLYFTSGSNEGVVKDGTDKLNKLLLNKAPKTMNWTFREIEGEEHRSTPFTTLYHGLKKYYHFYPELQFSNLEEFNKAGGLDYVYDYYKQRAQQFGFPRELTKWTMFTLVRNAMRANDYNQFDTFMNEFEKTNFFGELRINRACSIAEFYLENNQYDKAINLFTFLSEKHPNAERPLKGLGDTYKEMSDENKASLFYKKVKELSDKNSN